MDFDTEKFIIEIQNRPSIWNTRCPEYSDKNVKQREWEEVVNVYGAELSTEDKQKLGVNLQKRWKNIRDNFVKAHKSKETKSGSAMKKKNPYIFYNNLLFLKDTITINNTCSGTTIDTERKEDINQDKQHDGTLPANSSWTPKRNKKSKNNNVDKELNGIVKKSLQKKNDEDDGNLLSDSSCTPKRNKNNKNDDIAEELIGTLKKSLQKRNDEDDDIRLFLLSLVKEFKKIPDHLQLQTKVDILKIIRDAQLPDCPNSAWEYARSNIYYGYPMAHHSRNQPFILPVPFSEVGRVPPHETIISPTQRQSPLSMGSTDSQKSRDSPISYMELFDS